MAIKDILALAVRLEDDEPSLRAAGLVASHFEAHATALVLAVHAASVYAPEQAPLSEVLEDLAAGSRSDAANERHKIETWLSEAPHRFEIRDLLIESALHQKEVLAHARRADLSILTRGPTTGEHPARTEILETLLFGSGRPLILMPPGWRGERLWDRILVCWDAKRAAARAIADALPFLKLAHEVVLATVDARPRSGGHGPAPGKDIAVHLARHGVNVRIDNIDGMGRSEGKALLDASLAIDADLIVMGAYGHSRAKEWLLGGVTRELTQTSPTPLLLSH
jgi:nucleotide-binding universal stress UspA family protein